MNKAIIEKIQSFAKKAESILNQESIKPSEVKILEIEAESILAQKTAEAPKFFKRLV